MQIIFFKLELVIWWGREKNTFLFWKLFIKHHLIFFNTRIHLLICFWRYEHIVPHGQTPTAEQQNQFLAHCTRTPHYLEGTLWNKSTVRTHSRKIPTIYIRESCHLWFCFVPGFSGWGLSISTNSPRGCCAHGGDNSCSPTAAVLPKGTAWQGSSRSSPAPVCQGHGLFSSFADAQISLKLE